MKILIKQLSFVSFLFLVLINGSFAGDYGFTKVYQLNDNWNKKGEFIIVEEFIGTSGSPHHIAYGVFAKNYSAMQKYKGVEFDYPQRNRAYCEGLKVEIIPNKTDRQKIDVFLDYNGCKDELAKIKYKSELENIIDGTGAALLYTYHEHSEHPMGGIIKVILHIKGFLGHPKPFEREYIWGELESKWKFGPNGDLAIKK